MFVVRRLDTFLTSSSSVRLVVGCRCSSDYKDHESSRMMQKLINKHGAKAKKKWYQPHIAEPMEVFSLQQPTNKRGATPAQSIRVRQLSHVLYDKITQIINTGELSEEILNKQILITSVKMLSDFGAVHVYWDNNRSDAVEIEDLLQAQARKLRSLLISYHILGRIPPITFVKDQAMGDQMRLKQLFEVADYGPDYVPSSQQVKTQTCEASRFSARWGNSQESSSSRSFKAYTSNSPSAAFPVPDSVKMDDNTDVTTCAAAREENSNDAELIQSPDVEKQDLMQGLHFRSNLYGLPHEDLMKKVTAHKSKVKYSGTETSSTATDPHKFDIKQLKSRKDKMKLMSIKDSTKLKDRLLQIDAEDFIQTPSGNDDYVDEIQDDEYDYDHETKGN